MAGFLPPPQPMQPQEMPVYFESYLEKKEKKWISYWVVLRGPHLWFFKERTADVKKFVGRLDLRSNSQIKAGKTKKNNYQFTLTSSRGLYRLKTVNEEMRRKWITSIASAARGLPPPSPPALQPIVSPYPPQGGGYPPSASPHGPAQFLSPPPPSQQQPLQQHPYPGPYPPPSLSPGSHPGPGHAATLPAIPIERPPAFPPGGPSTSLGRRPPHPLPGNPPPVPSSSRPRKSPSEPQLLPGQRIAMELAEEEEERQRVREQTMKKRRSEIALGVNSGPNRSAPPLPSPGGSGSGKTGPYVPMEPGPIWKMNEAGPPLPDRPPTMERRKSTEDEPDYISPWESADWFYSPLSRDKSEELLRSKGRPGSFLIRESESRKGEFSLSILSEGKVRHFKIVKTQSGFVLSGSDTRAFPDLGALVVFYTEINKGTAQPLLKTEIAVSRLPPLPQPRSNFIPAELGGFQKELTLEETDEDSGEYLELDAEQERKRSVSGAGVGAPTPPSSSEAPPPPSEAPPPSSDEEEGTSGYEFPEFDGIPSPGPEDTVGPTEQKSDIAGAKTGGNSPSPLPPAEPPPPSDPYENVDEGLYDKPDPGGDSSPKTMYVNTGGDAYIAEDATD